MNKNINYLKKYLLAIFCFILIQSFGIAFDNINLEDKSIIREINQKKEFDEQNTFNLYFSYQTPVKWGNVLIEENDRDYFLNLTEQLTPSNHSINHLFVKVFCIYEDNFKEQHYIESVVLAKFHGYNSRFPGVSNYIGLSVTKKNIGDTFQTKRLIDFSSGTSKKEIRMSCISDLEVLTFIHSGQKTKYGHSEDRFFKLESASQDVDGKTKYNNSIFKQLIDKKANISEIDRSNLGFFNIECH